MAKAVLTHNLSEPLGSATTAKVEIKAGDGNLTIDRLAGKGQVLACGTLQYLENEDPPGRTLISSDGQATLTLRRGDARRSGFRMPWHACKGGTEWQIHVNPTVSCDLVAHSDGGNVKLNLAGMAISRVSADTGGGNVDVTLPDSMANLDVTAKTGAGNVAVEIGSGITGSNAVNATSGLGNVVVLLPSNLAARICVAGGLGKGIVDSRFERIDDHTFQSLDYDSAADKIEIALKSGAGSVSVNTK
jgi:hypothetical protein